ncbi:MAG TPA: GNAT family N-acetyltransferase [Burkholderiales bacterium]|nr:GNAT family N-acetyltransferase [Burkholderiales bacterium]
MPAYRVKLAETAVEREQIHRLNYQTFVEEIPQHPPNAERRLVDRFDAENEYAIALTLEGELAGMLAMRGRRPFSLDQKVARLDAYLPPHRAVCELRLLAVQRGHRGGTLFRRLVAFAAQRCIGAGYDLAVISGTTRQLELYRHLGFEPFGPLVGTPGAQFQPMHLSLGALCASAGSTLGVMAEATPGPLTPPS